MSDSGDEAHAATGEFAEDFAALLHADAGRASGFVMPSLGARPPRVQLVDARAIATAAVTAGGAVVAQAAERIPTIGSYHMPGVSARVQLIRFDAAGIAVSAGAACSSGTLKTSPVLRALGWSEDAADEVIRVSFGPQTSEAEVLSFIAGWRGMAKAKAA